MATLQPLARSDFSHLKYKRKFYHADDYLPRHVNKLSNGDNLAANGAVEKRASPCSDRLQQSPGIPRNDESDTRTNVSDEAIPSKRPRIVNDGANLLGSGSDSEPSDVTAVPLLTVRATTPDLNLSTSSSLSSASGQATSHTAFVDSLEKSTTHEMCLTLINMAFWSPNQQDGTHGNRPIMEDAGLNATIPQPCTVSSADQALVVSTPKSPTPGTTATSSTDAHHCGNVYNQYNRNVSGQINNHDNNHESSPYQSHIINAHCHVNTSSNNINSTDVNNSNNITKNNFVRVEVPMTVDSSVTSHGGPHEHTNLVYKALDNRSRLHAQTVDPQVVAQCPATTGRWNYNTSHGATPSSPVGLHTCSSPEGSSSFASPPDGTVHKNCIPQLEVTGRTLSPSEGAILSASLPLGTICTPPHQEAWPATTQDGLVVASPCSDSLHDRGVQSRHADDEDLASDTESTSTSSTSGSGIPESPVGGSTDHRTPGMSTSGPSSPAATFKKVSTLFPRPAKGRTLYEVVDIMARRHREAYYTGWPADKIFQLPPDERPNVFPVTAQLKKELVSKSVLTENKKLAFAFFAQTAWGHEFRQTLRQGVFKTLSDAKRHASLVWRDNCPEYDGSRAVRVRDTDGNIVMKRTRQKSGSEFEYRQSLRKAKVQHIVEQIWARRSVIGEALLSDRFQTLAREMTDTLEGYVRPTDATSQAADVIAYVIQKELLSVNSERIS